MKQITKILALMLFVGVIFSCDDTDDSDDMDGNNTAPTADAGDDITITLGETVTLDGGNSSDDDNDPLSYSWELTSQPSGSSVSIDNNENVQVQFIPDVAGSYTATLTVSDDDDSDDSDDETSEEDTDEVLITVEEPEQQTVVIDSDINEETNWVDIFEDDTPDYRLVENIDVNALLTISPGVIIEVDQNLGLEITSDGAIIADGESSNQIVFTSSNVQGGLKWKGLYIVSGDQRNLLNNVVMEHGGSDSYLYIYNSINAYVAGNISLADNAKLSLTNSTIKDSEGAGLVAKPEAEITSFENNNIEGNALYGILIHPNMVEMADNTSSFSGNGTDGIVFYQGTLNNGDESTWNPLSEGAKYYGLGELTVDNLLTLDAGVEILMEQELFIEISSDGGFIASGTVDQPIFLSAINAANGLRWGGLYVNSGDSRNSLNHVNIEYGGGDDAGYIYDGISSYVAANIFIDANGKLNIENTTISGSAEYGLVVKDGGELGNFSANSFEDNSSYAALMGIDNVPYLDGATTFDSNNSNSIRIYQSTISENGTLPKLHDSGFYRVADDIDIAGDIIVEAGANFQFDEDVFIDVNSSGSFRAIGTNTEHIVFTSSNTSGNIHWGGLYINSGSSQNELDYVDISYGGGDDMFYFYGSYNEYIQSNIGLTASAQLTINNCSIANSPDYGIAVKENGTINGSTLTSPNNIESVISVNTFSNITLQNVAFED